MPAEIPYWALREARGVSDRFYKSNTGHKRNLTLHIARALVARDERAARIARQAGDTWSGTRDAEQACQEAAVDAKCEEIAAAILVEEGSSP